MNRVLPSPLPFNMSVTETAKTIGKKIVEHPDDPVPVISAKDWVQQVARDPVQKVSCPLPFISESTRSLLLRS